VSEAPPAPAPDPGLELGSRLRWLRQLSGLSQRELASRAGLTHSNVSLIEQGQVSPSVKSFTRLLDVIPISLVQFFALDLSDPDSALPAGRVVRAHKLSRRSWKPLGLSLELMPGVPGYPRLRCWHLAPGGDTKAGSFQLTRPCSAWLISGKVHLYLGACCYTLSRGDTLALPAGQWLRARNPGPEEAVAIVAEPGTREAMD